MDIKEKVCLGVTKAEPFDEVFPNVADTGKVEGEELTSKDRMVDSSVKRECVSAVAEEEHIDHAERPPCRVNTTYSYLASNVGEAESTEECSSTARSSGGMERT